MATIFQWACVAIIIVAAISYVVGMFLTHKEAPLERVEQPHHVQIMGDGATALQDRHSTEQTSPTFYDWAEAS